MGRIDDGEEARSKCLSIRPYKIMEVFETDMEDLKFNPSTGISALMIYFIKNKANKKLIEELKKIKRDIDMHNVQIPPSF